MAFNAYLNNSASPPRRGWDWIAGGVVYCIHEQDRVLIENPLFTVHRSLVMIEVWIPGAVMETLKTCACMAAHRVP